MKWQSIVKGKWTRIKNKMETEHAMPNVRDPSAMGFSSLTHYDPDSVRIPSAGSLRFSSEGAHHGLLGVSGVLGVSNGGGNEVLLDVDLIDVNNVSHGEASSSRVSQPSQPSPAVEANHGERVDGTNVASGGFVLINSRLYNLTESNNVPSITSVTTV